MLKCDIYSIVHTKDFIEKWKKMLSDIYGYESYMDYLVVSSLLMQKTLSYVPLLDYTDRLSGDIDDLLEISKDNNYQIKILNPNYKNFKDNDTVNMRADVSSKDLNFISKHIFNSGKCRNQIKKAEKSGLISQYGNSVNIINDFYYLYKKNMLQHGVPIFSGLFFEKLNEHIDCDFIVTYYKDIPISSLVVSYDTHISSSLWAGIDRNYLKYCPNHSLYWKAIELAIQRNKKVFDFGRSPYGGATYKFKLQWGAKPIKVDTITNNQENIYKKYYLASAIWKKMPNKITNYIGPKLCKYLVDL
jgi:hypothetical protein